MGPLRPQGRRPPGRQAPVRQADLTGATRDHLFHGRRVRYRLAGPVRLRPCASNFAGSCRDRHRR
jgi:hypothetical protein